MRAGRLGPAPYQMPHASAAAGRITRIERCFFTGSAGSLGVMELSKRRTLLTGVLALIGAVTLTLGMSGPARESS